MPVDPSMAVTGAEWQIAPLQPAQAPAETAMTALERVGRARKVSTNGGMA